MHSKTVQYAPEKGYKIIAARFPKFNTKIMERIKFGIEFALCTAFLRVTRHLLAFNAARRRGNFPRLGSRVNVYQPLCKKRAAAKSN